MNVMRMKDDGTVKDTHWNKTIIIIKLIVAGIRTCNITYVHTYECVMCPIWYVNKSHQKFAPYEEESQACQIIEDESNHHGAKQESLLEQERFEQMEITFTPRRMEAAWLAV